MRKGLALTLVVFIMVSLVAGCGAPTPEGKEIITQVVKETVKETVIVEGTSQVVEKEVTKLVEKEVTRVVVATPTPPPEPTAAQAIEGPVSGGDVVYGLREPVTTFDPHAASLRTAAKVMLNVCEPLVVRGLDGAFYPGLAESWEISPDGMTYTFVLRKDVTFHDGTPFNAEAVKFNFDRVANPDNKLASLTYLGPYEATEVVDDYTVKLQMSEPYAQLMDGLSLNFLCIVSPAAVEKWGTDFGEHVVGTGPFIAEEIVTTDHVTLVKNPDYNWAPPIRKHQGPAFLDKITFVFVPELSTRVATLETGETDIVDGLEPESTVVLGGNPDVRIEGVPYPGTPRSLWLNTQLAPTDNLAVRRALSYAVNKQEIVDTLFNSMYPPATGLLTASSWSFNPDVQTYPFSQDKVNELMTGDGWTLNDAGLWEKDGATTHPVYLNIGGYGLGELAELVQGQLIKAGFDVEIVTLAAAAWVANVGEGKTHNLAPTMLASTDPGSMLQSMYAESMLNSFLNRSKVVGDTELQDGIEAQAVQMDIGKREVLLKEVQAHIMDQAYVIPLYDATEIYAYNSGVHDLTFEPTTYSILYDAWVSP